MSDALPEGWCAARLGDLVRPSRERAEPGTANGRPYLGMEHVESETGRVLGQGAAGEVRSTTVAYRAGDVLYGKLRPYLNKVCVAPFDGVGSTEFIVFGQEKHIDSRYLRWLLARHEFVDAANERAAGVQLPRVTFDKLADLEQPFAPLAEQRRIVDKVEALLEQVRRAKHRLDCVPMILKRFRQAVLAAACEGRLTEEWRAIAKPPMVKPPENLVGTDEQDNTESFVEHSPDSWAWAAIDDACEDVIDYRGRTPPTAGNGKIPHVRTTNVRGGRIDWSTEAFVTEAVYDQFMTRGVPRLGDVIFTMEAPLGEAAPVDTDRRFSLAQRLLLLRGERGLLEGSFLALILQSPQVQRSIAIRATGSTVLGIAYKRLKYVRLPIPSVREQAEIVRRVDALFVLAATVEQRVQRAVVRAMKLPQAILSKAFAGELVPTEAYLARAEGRDYETAEQLLRVCKSSTGFGKAEARIARTRKRRHHSASAVTVRNRK